MIRGQSIKALVESMGVAGACQRLGEHIHAREVKPEDISLRELAEAFMGYEWVRNLDMRRAGRFQPYDPKTKMGFATLREAGEGVDVTAFSHITGQIVYSSIHQGWDGVKERLDSVFRNVPTVFDGEKIPGIGLIKGEGEKIRPGMPYPESGFGEQYWETPATDKHGEIVGVTKEAIFFDRTSLVTQRAGKVGERLRMNKLVRMAAVIAGVTVTIGNESFVGNNHKWNGTTYNTYATGANAIGINALGSNPLVNFTSVEAILLLFAALTDPDTLRPIQIMPDTMIVMPNKKLTARRIANSTEVRTTYPGFATSQADPGVVQMSGPSPLDGYDVIDSPLLQQVVVASGISAANAKDWWFLTEKGKAFSYYENWPLTVIQAPPGGDADFERDIPLRWKASERGVPFSADPRYSAKGFAS